MVQKIGAARAEIEILNQKIRSWTVEEQNAQAAKSVVGSGESHVDGKICKMASKLATKRGELEVVERELVGDDAAVDGDVRMGGM